MTGPIGMFHCPECGQMVLAGMDHLDYSDEESLQMSEETSQPSSVAMPCSQCKQALRRFARLLIAMGIRAVPIPCAIADEFKECLAQAHRIDFFTEQPGVDS
ncbi:MAG: hypothetical protein ACREJW_09565 [Candidatus Methylomirabilales bacterium]